MNPWHQKFDRNTLWFGSDFHINHANLCRGTSKWPSKSRCRDFNTLEEMNQSIKDSLILPEGSTLFILGDILFGDKSKLPELVEHIRKTCSRLYLLYGNHDDYIRKNAEYVSLFDWCGDYTEIVVDKTLICLSHYPIRSWRDHNKGSFCLYGHCHCTISGLGRSMDVGWDYKNKPLNYEEIYQELIQIDPHKVDHH